MGTPQPADDPRHRDLFSTLAESGLIPLAEARPAPAVSLRDHLARSFPLADRRWKRPGPDRPFRVEDSDRRYTLRAAWLRLATVPYWAGPGVHRALARCA